MERERSLIQGRITVVQCIALLILVIVLVALLFPFVGSNPSPRPMKAQTDIRVIVNAVQNYYIDYGKYPVLETGSKTADIACGDPAAGITLNNAGIFNVLRDIDAPPNSRHMLNPLKIKYIETHVASHPSAPRDGFLEVEDGNPNAGCWYDPWGSQYNIVIDRNEDHVLDVGRFYTDFAGERAPQVAIGAFSLGKDLMLGKAGDRAYKKGNDYSDDRVSWTSH